MDRRSTLRLKIFGQIIKVLKKKGLLEKGYRGMYSPCRQEIVLDASLNRQASDHTLVHELVHAVWNRTGIDQANISPGIEEVLCENVATAITENFTLKLKK